MPTMFRTTTRSAGLFCLPAILAAPPLWADVLPPGDPRRILSDPITGVGFLIALAVLAGGVWWIRRRRKRS